MGPWHVKMPHKTCWGCDCCWCWCLETCWRQFVADLEAEVLVIKLNFYSESESYSLKSIQRITNSLAFSCQKFRYRHCRNRNRNSWFLFRSPPRSKLISTTTKLFSSKPGACRCLPWWPRFPPPCPTPLLACIARSPSASWSNLSAWFY